MARQGKKKRRKRHIKLMAISEPEPNTRTVLIYEGEGTIMMRGPGNSVMECGNCGAPLIQGVAVSQLQNLVFRCASCGQHNETMA